MKRKNMSKKKKAVLAFSGGLDTSYAVVYLTQEKNLDVYTVTVNTGGFGQAELNDLEKRALQLGALRHVNIDVSQQFYRECVRFLLFGNVLKNHTYPLSVSAERVFQAMAIADYAKTIKADYIAHGSTGAGNDQIRFDIIFHIMAPKIKILTPVRDQRLSRDKETAFLKAHGFNLKWKENEYSLNQGLWGTSIGGKETLTSHLPLPDSAYPSQVTEKEKKLFKLHFSRGEFSGYNASTFEDPVLAISELNKELAGFGIGRDIHVGDTILGIKGRVAFEAPAPLILIKAHQALEKHVLTKWQIHWKDTLSSWYGMWLHEGQFLDPVMRDIEKMMESSQKNVTGTVFVKVAPEYFKINGIKSKYDLMHSSFGTYGEMNVAWSPEEVRGFAKLLATQSKIYYQVNGNINHD